MFTLRGTLRVAAHRRYKGSGETGCRPETICAEANGGCDPLTTCTNGVPTVCGPCPMGYEGTGETGCVDIDGCAGNPCFAGTECFDVPAGVPGPGVPRDPEPRFTCAGCPEGYRDVGGAVGAAPGVKCGLCSLVVAIVSSTVVEGRAMRSQLNQIIAAPPQLDHQVTTLSPYYASLPLENSVPPVMICGQF